MYYFVCFAVSALLAVVHIFRWKNQYGLHYTMMYVCATIANYGYWQIYQATELNQAILANKIAYVGGCFSTLALMMCIFSVCKVEISRAVKGMLFALTCFVYGTSLTVGYSGIFYKNVSLEAVDGRYRLVKEYGPFHTVFYIMLVVYVMISLCVLVVGFRKKQEVSLKSVCSIFIVLLINFLSFFAGRALFDIELITASYVITEIVVQMITNRLILYNVDEMVIASMMDAGETGVAAFDFDSSFFGCNDIARKYYPQLGLLAVDKKIDREKQELKQLAEWIGMLGRDGLFEKIYQKEDRYYKVTGQYLYDRNKKRGYNLIFTDYTEEKQRGEELVRVATKAKSDMLAQMSHEIRTPINAIIGMNEMILRTTRESESKQYAEDIKRASNSLLEIVNEILDFSKIEAGKMELRCMEYNLSDLVEDLARMFRIRAEDKGLVFQVFMEPSLPSVLYGDDVKIRQILTNLLSNAVKYTPEGTVELAVKGLQKDGCVSLRFAVKDTGIGIRPEDRQKLFSEFERIEEKQNRGIEGTGLGMSITIRLLKMMDSVLQMDSVYGEGSEFYFDLEQRIVDPETVETYQERRQKEQKGAVYQKAFIAPEAKILVVDDNKMNRKVFCSILRETRMQIDEAESGADCLELVRRKPYDLIFLDHMMPEMDGVETLHRLKKLPDSRCQNTPVIVLTANAVSGAREFYLTEGFDYYLSKPFQPDVLEKMILERLSEEVIQYMEEAPAEWPEEQINSPEKRMNDPEEARKIWPEIPGMDWAYGLSHFKNTELYLKTMEEFYQTMAYEAGRLRAFYEDVEQKNGEETVKEVMKKYRVQIHSMKGAASLIGAVSLGKTAG